MPASVLSCIIVWDTVQTSYCSPEKLFSCSISVIILVSILKKSSWNQSHVNNWFVEVKLIECCSFCCFQTAAYCTSAFWTTTRRYSKHGAHMISFFLDLMRRKVSSLLGSKSLTVLLAFWVSEQSRPAYCTVVELSRVVRIGMPSWLMTMVPVTPLWAWILFSTSSTSLIVLLVLNDLPRTCEECRC